MGEIQEALPRLEAAGLSFVGVSVDTPEEIEELRDDLDLTLRLVPDPRLEIAAAYGVREEDGTAALPASFVIAPDREVLHTIVGDSPSDRPGIDELLKLAASR